MWYFGYYSVFLVVVVVSRGRYFGVRVFVFD